MTTSIQVYPMTSINQHMVLENDKFMTIVHQVIEFRNENRGSKTLDERSELLFCMFLNNTNWWVEDRHYIYVCMEKISFDKYMCQEDCEFFMTALENMAEDAMMNEDTDACTEDTY